MITGLEEYQQKRNFEHTFEPQGSDVYTSASLDNLSFVVQHHLARRDHYDFRLEWKGVLLSWAVPKGPSYNPSDKRLAIQVEDHPYEYKNFEGLIPKGEYGGGTVMLWDEGYWKPQYDVNDGLEKGVLKFELFGKRLKGNWALIRLEQKEGETKQNWLLLKEKDEYTLKEDGIASYDTSIRTGRTMQEIEKGTDEKFIKNPISHIDVQLAKLVDQVPKSGDWLYEIKYDGYRIVAFVEGNNALLITRNGKDFSKHFADIALSLSSWANGRAMILDGEMVVTDRQGKTDFQALQNYMKSPKDNNLTYIVFDLLALDGKDLREQPLTERKQILQDLMKDAPDNIHYSQHVEGSGKQSFEAACELGMEGIIGKKANSKYSGTRKGDWIKIKCANRQELVIGGYTRSDKKTKGISSILLGFYDSGNLVYAGRAGTGMTEKQRIDLENKFDEISQDSSPFKDVIKPKTNETITWIEPKLVAEISFAEWTKDNQLRQASFKGLRLDKNPKEIVREKPEDNILPEEKLENKTKDEDTKKPSKEEDVVLGIKISNPDKIIFQDPVLNKIDIARYYEQVAERMMPYVGNRILSSIRCPKGIDEQCFFKKHPAKKSQGIATIPIKNSQGQDEEYFYIENNLGIISEVQLGTVEFHVWGSQIDDPEKPDMMVFDLDPDEGMDLAQVRQGVKDLKSLLDSLPLISYLKTSGGKGYHVVVPFRPTVNWETFHDFAKSVAKAMNSRYPDRYTDNIRKAKRKGRIFIDYVRNARSATSIAPYSLRARKGASVSMPISWEELDTIAPNGVDIKEALLRIKAPDPWKDFYKTEQELKV